MIQGSFTTKPHVAGNIEDSDNNHNPDTNATTTHNHRSNPTFHISKLLLWYEVSTTTGRYI